MAIFRILIPTHQFFDFRKSLGKFRKIWKKVKFLEIFWKIFEKFPKILGKNDGSIHSKNMVKMTENFVLAKKVFDIKNQLILTSEERNGCLSVPMILMGSMRPSKSSLKKMPKFQNFWKSEKSRFEAYQTRWRWRFFVGRVKDFGFSGVSSFRRCHWTIWESSEK